jgi:hypothetical protein
MQIPPPVPAPEDLDEIVGKNADYAKVKLLLLVGPDGSEGASKTFPKATLIRPFHANNEEAKVAKAFTDADRDLLAAFANAEKEL